VIRISDANHLAITARELLDDNGRTVIMSERALAFAAHHRGATDKTINLVTHLLK
jgi:hypothetical protein